MDTILFPLVIAVSIGITLALVLTALDTHVKRRNRTIPTLDTPDIPVCQCGHTHDAHIPSGCVMVDIYNSEPYICPCTTFRPRREP